MRTIDTPTAKNLDWAHYEKKAGTMTDAELSYARRDAFQAAQAVRLTPTEGLYYDEIAVYAREQLRRFKKEHGHES